MPMLLLVPCFSQGKLWDRINIAVIRHMSLTKGHIPFKLLLADCPKMSRQDKKDALKMALRQGMSCRWSKFGWLPFHRVFSFPREWKLAWRRIDCLLQKFIMLIADNFMQRLTPRAVWRCLSTATSRRSPYIAGSWSYKYLTHLWVCALEEVRISCYRIVVYRALYQIFIFRTVT